MESLPRRRSSYDHRRPGRLSATGVSPLATRVQQQEASVANSTSAAGMEATIHLLPYELYVISLQKDSLATSTHSLLQLLLKLFGGSESRRNHFFSFTETSTDYSFIVDKELLKELKPIDRVECKIELADTKWRPLVVEVGALGSLSGISKIAANVISPLADHKVSVFCLSTNLDDYVLIKQSDLDRALSCLSKTFRLISDSDNKADIALVDSIERRTGCLDSPVRLQTPRSECNPPARPIIHPYFSSSCKFRVCGVVPDALPAIGAQLLQIMLFNPRSSSDESFFSLSIVEEDISMVIDCRDVNRFPEDSLYLSEECWRMIRIGEEPLGFDECGIVAQVSAPLAQAEISTYYISTFYTDHTLVLDESANKALQLLNKRYVAKVITCEKQQQQQLQRQANQLTDCDDSDSISMTSSLSSNSLPSDPSPLIHSYAHPILINSHA